MNPLNDPVEIADLMNTKGKALSVSLNDLETHSLLAAQASAAYDCEMAKAILRLKQEHQVTVVDKLARGECYTLKLEKETAEAMVVLCRQRIAVESLKITCLQSVYKHLQYADN